MTKQTVVFSNSAFAPKREKFMSFERKCLIQTSSLTKTLRNKLLLLLLPNRNILKLI